MNRVFAVCFLSLITALPTWSRADTFGSGAISFEIEFVTIGQPGNPPDTSGDPNPAGSVPYTYRIGKYEISEQMIDKANALSAESGTPLGITKDSRGLDKPATRVSWFEAAKFVNWLNTSTSSAPAYKFDDDGNFQLWTAGDVGYNSANPFRNTQARYFLPSTDEWYKAAYYDPIGGIFYDFPTGSNSVPDGIDFAGDTTFDAVFDDGGSNIQPNDVSNVGLSSPYGTEGQGGNVWEWAETEGDGVNDNSSTFRNIRGGMWWGSSDSLRSVDRAFGDPSHAFMHVGFRVAGVPEPSSIALVLLALLPVVLRRRPFR